MLKKFTLAGVISSLFVFVLPFISSPNLFYGTINGRYFLIIGFTYALVLLGIYKFLQGGMRLYWKKRWLPVIMGVVFVIMVVSSLFGVHTGQSFWSDILRGTGVIFIGHIGLMAILLGELLQKNDWALLRRSFIVSAAIFSLVYFFSVQGLGFSGKFLFFNLELHGLTLGNTTFAAAYIVFGIIFTLIELRSVRKWSKVFFAWSFALFLQVFSPLFFNANLWTGRADISQVFTSPSIVLGIARASAMTLILVGLYLFGRFVIRKVMPARFNVIKIKRWYTVICAGGLLLMVVLLFVPKTFVQNAYIQEASAARIIVWNAGWQGIAERPLLGWGPENFEFTFTEHFDNRLYLDEYLGEIWFDRAHNVFIDTLVMVGVLGMLALIMLMGRMIYVLHRASEYNDVPHYVTHLMGVLLIANLVQLQTSFEVTLTYFAGGLVLGYILWLERYRVIQENDSYVACNGNAHKNLIALTGVVFVILGSIYFIGAEFGRQKALYRVFTEPNPEQRLIHVDNALDRTSAFEMYRLASASFISGATNALGAGVTDPDFIAVLKNEAKMYEKKYDEYITHVPDDYRARINLVQILFFETILGDNQLEKARTIIADSYHLSPENPLTYAMESLSYTYAGNFEKAGQLLDEAAALNPDIEFTQEVQAHLGRQMVSFPTITFLTLENI